MTRFGLLLMLSAAFIVSGTSVASEIYQWTDEDGNVHYGDRPVQGAQPRRDILSARTNTSAVQARVQQRREAKAAAEKVAAEAPPEMSKEEVRAEQQKRQEQCNTYRAQLETLLQAPRLYDEDENGERTYLDEEQRLAARERVEEQINEYCGS